MNNLNETLPDLMRRATETLEPESTDLVERGIRRGTTLRRRRTALLSFSGAGAVLATAGVVIGGTQLFGGPQQGAPVAGTPTTAAGITPTAAVDKPATTADTLATLRKLVPGNLQVSKPGTWGGGKDEGLNGASLILNDGKGASQVTAAVYTNSPMENCEGWEGYCKVRPDGSFLITINERRDVRQPNNPKAVVDNSVEIHWKDGRAISLASYNAVEEKGSGSTRPKPILSVATLLKMAESDQWGFPAKPPMPTRTPVTTTVLPPVVPVASTLATLKKVLPGNPQLTKPQTRGGDKGFNGASYVANDGKGAAQIDVLLTTDTPVKKCPDEGLAHCKVRADGSVLTWTKEAPSYTDGRQSVNGITGNFVQLYFPDGRRINLTAFNGPSEKDDKHTRPKPIYTIEQLTTMASSNLWVFPGGMKISGGGK